MKFKQHIAFGLSEGISGLMLASDCWAEGFWHSKAKEDIANNKDYNYGLWLESEFSQMSLFGTEYSLGFL